MKVRYICIEREYGSGAGKIAAEAARRCGINCYGSEIMEQVARKEQVSLKALEECEEKVSSSLLYSFFVISQSQTGDPDLVSQEGKLYVAESRVIKELARSGPAIFVGHCASKVLEDEPGVLSVFIHGSEEDKHRRIRDEYGVEEKYVAAACKKVNRRRSNYYSFCTQKKWDDLKNYDLVLDSSSLGSEGCVKLLCAAYDKREKD